MLDLTILSFCALNILLFILFHYTKSLQKLHLNKSIHRRFYFRNYCDDFIITQILPKEIYGYLLSFLDNKTLHSLHCCSKNTFNIVWNYQSVLKFQKRRTKDNVVINTLYKCNPASLKWLDLTQCQHISSKSLKPLKFFNNLTTLNLSGCPKVDIKGLQYLTSCKKLKQLHLDDCFTCDEGLSYVGLMTSLEYLSLFCNSSITDEGLKHLKNLHNLSELNLAWCIDISNEGISHLSSLHNLTSIDLIYCQNLNDSGLIYLEKLSKITKLKLHGHRFSFTDRGIEAIGKLSNLTHLSLPGFGNLTIKGIAHLTNLTKLQYLSLERGNLDNDCMSIISEIKSLKHLEIERCHRITDTGAYYISLLKNLVVLNLTYCIGINNEGLHFLSKLKELEKIFLTGLGVTDDGLVFLNDLPKLNYLSLSSCLNITPDVSPILRSLKSLRGLNLNYSCVNFSDKDLKELKEQLPNVKIEYKIVE